MKISNASIFVTGTIIVMLLIPNGIGTNTVEGIDVESDSVGDIHVKAKFYFRDGAAEMFSFKVFNQQSGFDATKAVKFELTGAPSPEKAMLYKVTDTTHNRKNLITSDLEFDVVVEIYQGENIFRFFTYTNCYVSSYNFVTLYDAEETFSGKTKFVYADVHNFTCRGYIPGSVLYAPPEPTLPDTESSLDLEDDVPTWEDHTKFQ